MILTVLLIVLIISSLHSIDLLRILVPYHISKKMAMENL